jgi:hypothetical protein
MFTSENNWLLIVSTSRKLLARHGGPSHTIWSAFNQTSIKHSVEKMLCLCLRVAVNDLVARGMVNVRSLRPENK